eukprot:1516632-Prymnesium_polylepis.1
MIGRYTTAAIPRAAKDYIETICKYETSNNSIDKIPKTGPTAPPTDKESANKKISIEQARQHEHNLKEREKQRVAKLEDMMRI